VPKAVRCGVCNFGQRKLGGGEKVVVLGGRGAGLRVRWGPGGETKSTPQGEGEPSVVGGLFTAKEDISPSKHKNNRMGAKPLPGGFWEGKLEGTKRGFLVFPERKNGAGSGTARGGCAGKLSNTVTGKAKKK